MSEADAIALAAADPLVQERGPATTETLVEDLRALGVAPGQTLIVHASLSKLGWVVGGAISVIEAIEQAVGETGTIAMPTHTAALTDPRHWRNPPVPKSWWKTIRKELPAFDPRTTPSREMGAIAETFRTLPGVLRSNHPVGSLAAHGPTAELIVASHPLDDVFGEGSPYGRLYDLGALVLLLGVGHQNNTILHLAEARTGDKRRKQGSPVFENGKRKWVTYDERMHDSDPFPGIVAAYVEAGKPLRKGKVGAGQATLAPVRGLVDFAAEVGFADKI